MKNLLLFLAFWLGINLSMAQNKEAEKPYTRVEKIYDENGKLVHSDSIKMASSSRLKEKLRFYFKKDSSSPERYFQFPDHLFDLEIFQDKYDLDSIIEYHHDRINFQLKKLEQETLINFQNLKNEIEWKEYHQSELSEFKKHIETLDSLIELKTKQIENYFKTLKEPKKKNTQRGK